MEPNYLDELKKLKAQKDADLNQSQPYDSPSIPNFEEAPAPVAPAEPTPPADETIKFEPVTQPSEDRPVQVGSRRARKPSPEEIARRKKKKKIKMALIISGASLVAVIATLLIVFFAVKNANLAKFSYEYWGMGLNIENGVKEYDFFGNIESMTRFDQTGQPQLVAEFEDGLCIKETRYDAEGNVICYYTHEYVDGVRSLSAYFTDGKMVYSEKYTVQSSTSVRADRTFHQEENRVENGIITLEDGKIVLREIYVNTVLTRKDTYNGDLITQVESYDDAGLLKNRIVREYDTVKKLMLSEVIYDGNAVTLSRTVNEYDAKTDLLKKIIRYDGLGEIIDYDTYNYDLNNNPIKQVRYAKDGTIQEQIVRVFNDKNKVTKETYIGADGMVTHSMGYDYDDSGFISKSIVYSPENDGTTIKEYTVYTRSPSGAITQLDVFNANNIQTKKTLFNAAGFITEHYDYSELGVLLNVEKFKYDAKQNVINKETSTYAEDSTLLLYLNEQYDEKGQVMVYTIDDTKANRHEQVICRYDAEGNLAQQTIFDKSGKPMRDVTLDAEGRIVKELLYDDGRESELNEYVYNEEGMIVQKKATDRKTGTLKNSAYTYDKDGIRTSEVISDAQNRPVKKLEYNENGLITVQTLYDAEAGIPSSIEQFEYDTEDRIIVKEVLDGEENVLSKIVYYYRPDGSYDYTEYDENGKVIADSRGDEYIDKDENTDTGADGSDTSDSAGSDSGTDGTGASTDSGNPSDTITVTVTDTGDTGNTVSDAA